VDPAALSGGQIAVFGGPREKFKKAEIDAVPNPHVAPPTNPGPFIVRL